MSTPLHVLLLPDASLEGDIADGKADPSVCHKLASWPADLARGLSCCVFKGQLAPWTTNMGLDRLHLIEKFLPQWLHWIGKKDRVGSRHGQVFETDPRIGQL